MPPKTPHPRVSRIQAEDDDTQFKLDTSPIGANNQPGVPQKPQSTPRDGTRRVADGRLQTELREAIAEAMNDETVYCTVDEFMSHYLPFSMDQEQAAGYIANVKANATLFDSEKPPSRSGLNEAACYRYRLNSIVDAVRKLDVQGRQHNEFNFEIVPNKHIHSRMVGSNHRTDAVLREGEGGVLHATDIVVAMELKKERDLDSVRLNQLQLAGVCVSIMNDDARRAFTYGITIEDHRMSLWYFSRSHSVKSQSFDFAKKPDILIKVFIAFIFGTPEELGFSPFVTRNNDGTYIYKLETDEQTRYYKATHSFEDYRNLCVARRSTRILKVVEVVSATDHTPTETPENPKVLKDVWIQEDALSEAEIQHQLFADIEVFGMGDWKTHPCLQAFLNDEDGEVFLTQLEQLLEGQKYRDLFLIIAHMAKGEICKQLAPDARLSPPVFVRKSNAKPEPDQYRCSTRITDIRNEVMTRNTAIRPPADVQPASHRYRGYARKQRHFYIFNDFCTAVHYLPSIGDAFDVLEQCTTALRLMHCAGWVHRDISVGNILAIQDANGLWCLKLADLEYAKRFPVEGGSSDPKTGTPFFMAIEILKQRYITLPASKGSHAPQFGNLTKTITNDTKAGIAVNPVKHNFHHDLESLFWIILWLLTSRVKHQDSEAYAARFFRDSMTLPQPREDAFKTDLLAGIKNRLHPDLQQLAGAVNKLRRVLYQTTKQRARRQAWDKLVTYTQSHLNCSLFFLTFNAQLDQTARLQWRSVMLQPRNPNKLYPAPLNLEILDPEDSEVPSEQDEEPPTDEPLEQIELEEPDDPGRVAPVGNIFHGNAKQDDNLDSTSNKRSRDGSDDAGRDDGAKRSRANDGRRSLPGFFSARADSTSPSPAPRSRGQRGTQSHTAGARASGSRISGSWR